ncbi:hypothetical protein DDB_G0273539 [Dictyostelium discoideum AX4]|uniref:Aminopeptidase n=1 Tax=Dictyostelium discoideum TaxID=44689 RepID=Q557I4_DICDI|nr:hypothetical protein DDB_G0273419 [Dictyostelium discoideum AX4]XP_644651.1 hypothetical protein DDB_G0273539 [Dictyostelium discoideum AX4]EAL70664.1 hypothetical protein DDB_G0273419 [Dictyostelium discoideum AX4]EAL70724.1 hypothetical protein DDB_G0273539 [Dictyostelium discoideum AX4]|eukprot:XP_644600.1 hypothetical protein DDB_G0273419 [Dictyostelium discoideum AX4]
MRNIKHIQLKDMEEIDENDEEFEIDGDDIRPRKKSEFQSTQNKSTFKRLFEYLTETNFKKSLLIIAFCSFFIIFTITASLATKVISEQIIYSNIKLPGNVIPIHYFTHVDIRMEPKFNFNGTIVSTLNITSDKNDFIVIHADESTLSLNSIHLVSVPKYNSSKPVNSTDFDLESSITPTNKVYSPENSYYILFFKDLKKFLDKNGSIFNLYISYNGSLVDSEGTSTLRGLYLSSYKNPSNHSESKYLAVTQFEPVDARLSFPCFDEPSLKANWTIWITHPNNYKALSNMPAYLVEDNKVAHKTTTRFDTTPKMSSYLVCIVVHQFSSKSDFIDRRGKEGATSVPLTVWAADHLMDTVDFSLDMAKKSFVFFEDYFDILYPLPKMDLVAIPDFAAGAMENFGLMTFRESDLLYSNKTSDQENKQRVAEVVSHEIAHQWFGDLVTMKWWNDLWLNEGFATFMSYKCMQKVLIDEFDSEEIFQYSSKQPGLDIDASPFTHTISNNYTDPLDIMASFDSVTYDKGSSILLMLEAMIDRVKENAFRDGIRNYLKKYAYGNAETNDLWEMLYDSIARDPIMVIPDIMNQWTTYPGFPQIKIDSIGNNSYRITQSKFTQPNTTRPSDFNANSIWWMPIKVIDNCENTDDLYISNKSIQYKGWSDQACGTPAKDSFIFANSDATGFYRTLYDSSIFDKIVNRLNENATEHFTTLQRISFADDLYAFSKIGAIPTSVALKTFYYTTVSVEPNFVVWKDILSFLSFVHNRLETVVPCYIQYIKKAQYIFNKGLLPLIKLNITSDDELSYNQLELRKSAFSKVNSLSITSLRIHLNQIYLDNIDTPENIDPSIRAPLFSSIIQNGDIEEYEWVVNRFENTNAINERIDALKAISNPKNPQLIRNTLKMLLDGKIKSQDFYMVFLEMSYSPFARELAWNFLLDNFNFISENSTPGDIGKYVTYFASSMDSQAKIDQIKQFFTDAHPIPASSLANAISSIQYNMNWLKNQAPELCNFLNK